MSDTRTAPEVCIIGSGTRFLSGISYYTLCLANALNSENSVSVILMRQLIPTFLYPGRNRVGIKLTDLEYDHDIRVFDGVDWHWIPSIVKALVFLVRERPRVLIFQWWTGTALHTYVLLALVSRLLGAKVIIEFHELLDTAELRIPFINIYLKLLMKPFIRMASAFVVHSEHDKPIIADHYHLKHDQIQIIHHGPYDQYLTKLDVNTQEMQTDQVCNLLYFGVIRPYKGLEDLVVAFNAIPADEISKYWLTVVGESWEGWSLPIDLIKESPYRDRITLVNRYVKDDEVADHFAKADVVVLPYRRSSASGPLHIAMSHGLPVVVTQVGGLKEAVANYDGAILVLPESPEELKRAIFQAYELKGKRFTDPHSWQTTVMEFGNLFKSIGTAQKVTA